MAHLIREIRRALFDHDPSFCDMHEDVAARATGKEYLRYIRRQIREHLGDRRLSILDAGCQAGRLLIPLAEEGHRVTGLDASIFALRRAHQHARARRLSVCWVMSSWVSLVSLLLVFSRAPLVTAEPVGSPAKLEKGQWVFGIGGGGLVKRAMQGGAKASVYQVEHFRGYGLTDRLSLYGRIGVAYLNVDDRAFPSQISSGFGANVLLGTQMKAILWQSPRKTWRWDASGQYLYLGAPHKRKGNQVSWQEGQFATTLVKSFGPVTPYVGAKVSLLRVAYLLRSQTAELRSRYRPDGIVGPVVGLDWSFGENRSTVLNFEGSYINGAEVTLALTTTF